MARYCETDIHAAGRSGWSRLLIAMAGMLVDTGLAITLSQAG